MAAEKRIAAFFLMLLVLVNAAAASFADEALSLDLTASSEGVVRVRAAKSGSK